MKNVEDNKQELESMIAELKETLNPDICRCFVDAFLTRQKSLEVRRQTAENPLLQANITDRPVCIIFPLSVCYTRSLKSRIHTIMMKTWSTVWWICLQPGPILQEPHFSGVYCSWPSTLIFKVQTHSHMLVSSVHAVGLLFIPFNLNIMWVQTRSMRSWSGWLEAVRSKWRTGRTCRTLMLSSMKHREWPTFSHWRFLTKPAETSPSRATSSKRSVTYICCFCWNCWSTPFPFLWCTLLSSLPTGDHCVSSSNFCPVWWERMGEPTHFQPFSLPG